MNINDIHIMLDATDGAIGGGEELGSVTDLYEIVDYLMKCVKGLAGIVDELQNGPAENYYLTKCIKDLAEEVAELRKAQVEN